MFRFVSKKIHDIHHSLGGKVLSLLAGSLFLAFTYMIGVGSWAEYLNTSRLIHEANGNQTVLIAQQSRHGIMNRDKSYLENVFFDLVFNQDERVGDGTRISMIHVYTETGEVLKSFETWPGADISPSVLKEIATQAIYSRNVASEQLGSHQLIASPVRSDTDGRIVGAVGIAWDETGPMRKLTEHAFRLGVIGAASALLVIIVLMITMRQIVVQPIVELADCMIAGRMAEGDVELPDELLGRADEIGRLSRRFRSLIGDLTVAQRELKAKSEAEIEKRNQRLDAALNNMSQGLCLFDENFRLVICNDRFLEMYGLSGKLGAHGTPLHEIVIAMMTAGNFPNATVPELMRRFTAAQHSPEQRLLQDDLSSGRTISILQVPRAEGGWVITFEDVTERREAEARIEHMARYDDLTGLPNRASFRRELADALRGIERGGDLAVFCLDLDQFKPVNDTLGHPVGDKLLEAVADRLRSCLRQTDVVARLGGDEFAIIMKDFDGERTPATLATRIIGTLSDPFRVEGHQVVIGSSIGIVHAPKDAQDADTLVKLADLALYRAKADGRGVFRYFEAEMDERIQERRKLEIDLRAAMANGEFVVEYQPIVNVNSGSVSCFEALIRWNHPERGRVSPDDFIPLAEETGLIVQVGSWVLMQACMDARSWPGDIRVAVNLSPMQFRDEDLVMDVMMALKRSGLEARRLELEITETVLLQDTETTSEILRRIRELGVRISMDDFGTGYCSLSYLQKFPLDKIKIDKSFVDDIDLTPDAAAIIRAIAGLGANLGMCTTAEGVETARQLQRLRDEGLTEVQGYYFSRSVPSGEIAGLLENLHQRGAGERKPDAGDRTG